MCLVPAQRNLTLCPCVGNLLSKNNGFSLYVIQIKSNLPSIIGYKVQYRKSNFAFVKINEFKRYWIYYVLEILTKHILPETVSANINTNFHTKTREFILFCRERY